MNRREVLAGVSALTLAGCGQPEQASGAATQQQAVAVPGDDPFVGASLM